MVLSCRGSILYDYHVLAVIRPKNLKYMKQQISTLHIKLAYPRRKSLLRQWFIPHTILW